MLQSYQGELIVSNGGVVMNVGFSAHPVEPEIAKKKIAREQAPGVWSITVFMEVVLNTVRVQLLRTGYLDSITTEVV